MTAGRHVSASSQSLRFTLSLRLYSGSKCDNNRSQADQHIFKQARNKSATCCRKQNTTLTILSKLSRLPLFMFFSEIYKMQLYTMQCTLFVFITHKVCYQGKLDTTFNHCPGELAYIMF